MTGTNANGIEIDRDFAAPPAAVFAAWTTPEHFARWFGGKDVQVPLDSLDFIAEPGRAWTAQMVLPDGHTIDWAGEFIEVVPDERLVFTLTDRPAEPVQAQIVIQLTAIPGGTRMHFTQETPGFSPEQQAGVLAGWQSFIDELERIATVNTPSGSYAIKASGSIKFMGAEEVEFISRSPLSLLQQNQSTRRHADRSTRSDSPESPRAAPTLPQHRAR